MERLEEIQIPTAIISSASIVFLWFSRCALEPWLNSVFDFPIPYELLLVSFVDLRELWAESRLFRTRFGIQCAHWLKMANRLRPFIRTAFG